MKTKLLSLIGLFFLLAHGAVAQTQPGVSQYGAVTSNHIAVWVGNGFLKDGGSTPGAGTVTSVALTGDNVLYNSSITGSPVTSAGTFNLSSSLKTQSANVVLASPNGSTGAASFRALVGADLPVATSTTFGAVDVPINGGLNLSAGSLSLAAPTTSVLGGVLGAASASSNSWVTYIDTTGLQHVAQPNFSNLAGTAAIGQGGTGQTALGSANSCLQTNSGVTGTVWGNCTGSGTGTVTSVAVSGGTTGLTTSGGPITTSGTITFAGTLAAANGGTGISTSASTGVAQIASGTWSASTALANGTTATTQTAGDNSTKVATTAYIDRGSSGASAVLLGTVTASNSASIQFTSIPSGYDQYVLRISGLIAASSGTQVYLRYSENNGSSYIATNYTWSELSTGNNGGAPGYSSSASSDTQMIICNLSINNTYGYNGVVTMMNLSSSTLYKPSFSDGHAYDGLYKRTIEGGTYTGDTNTVNAIEILMSSGNITSGKFSLYGMRNQ